MTDYMLTVITRDKGARDVQVNGADSIRHAIVIAEKATGAIVDHGRGGIGSEFDPAIVIDATTGEVDRRHDKNALDSMSIVKGPNARGVAAALGEGRRRS